MTPNPTDPKLADKTGNVAACRSYRAVVAAAAAVVCGLAGCGATGQAPPGPTVAASELGGVYMLVSLDAQGVGVELVDPVEIIIDAEFGELRISTGCGTLLGSFSLLADGRAGFTIAGGSTRACTPQAQNQQDELAAALGRLNSWSGAGSGSGSGAVLDLRSPSADRIQLDR